MSNEGASMAAVVLAGGMSARMGETKQLLPFRGMPLLEAVIRQLLPHPFSRIVAVVGHEAERIMQRIVIGDARFEWQVNPRYSAGMSSSLQGAAARASDLDGMLVFLGDQPLIRADTIERVRTEALRRLTSAEDSLVVQPAYSGSPGHPVFFSRGLFPYFAELQGDEGGRRVIGKAFCRCMLPVEDPGILCDIDTREDYERLALADLRQTDRQRCE